MTIKNIVIFTLGTRGDVQPYIYLARSLKRKGLVPTIATHPCWRTLVEDAGVDFSPIGPDIDISYEAALIRGKSAHWFIGAIKTMKFVFKIIEGASDEIYKLCQSADLVIASHSHVGSVEAQACQKPIISVTLQAEAISQPYKPRTRWQRLTETMMGTALNPMIVGPFNKIRKKYMLEPIKTIDEIMSPYLNLIPISAYIVPQNPYWEEKDQVVGYWYEDDEPFEPAPELRDFLESGSKPVIVALGAMAFESKDEKNKLDILIHAFQQTGMRAILQGFDETLKNYELPKSVIKVGSVPHSWLFSRGYCVIHHGGLGTSAAAILAGKPSIVIPHVLDQFMWANKVFELNAGMKPIKANELSENALVATIGALKTDYEQMIDKVQLLGSKMKEENGLKTAVALIQKVCEGINSDCVI